VLHVTVIVRLAGLLLAQANLLVLCVHGEGTAMVGWQLVDLVLPDVSATAALRMHFVMVNAKRGRLALAEGNLAPLARQEDGD
jgi:hypothetical protein